MSEMKTVVDPELAVAHLVFKVADLKSSSQIYLNLGPLELLFLMSPVAPRDNVKG